MFLKEQRFTSSLTLLNFLALVYSLLAMNNQR